MRQELLAHAGAALARSLDPQVILATTARLAVAAEYGLADMAIVALTCDTTADAGMDLVGLAHRDPAKEALLRQRYQPALDETRPQLAFPAELAPHSTLVVSLSARGRVLGAICLGRSAGPFDQRDRAIVEDLAQLSALTLDNARLYQAAEQSREEAHRMASRYRRIFESNMVGIGCWDASGRISDANQALLDLIGYGSEDLLAGTIDWRRLTPPEYAARDQHAIDELARTALATPYEKEYIRRDGTRVPVMIGCATWEGRTDAGPFFALDVSELKQAVRSRDDFLSIASHELRTPLTALSLQVDALLNLLARSAPDLARLQAKARVVRRQTDRLEQLVRQLLDVSRLAKGRLELVLEEVDLCAVVSEAVERLGEQARQGGCELRLSAQGPVVGQWDRGRLEQVLTNLLSNAIKYGQQQPVEVSVRAVGQHAQLSVRDHGIGIAREDQERIFGRFQRAVSERHYGGLGLGLWIVRQIVGAMGGSISVDSSPGQGACFMVEVPLRSQRSSASVPPRDR